MVLDRLKAQMRSDQTGRLGCDPDVSFVVGNDEVSELAKQLRADGRFDPSAVARQVLSEGDTLRWVEAMIRAGRVCIGTSPVRIA